MRPHWFNIGGDMEIDAVEYASRANAILGRLAGMIAEGYFDAPVTASKAHTELQRRGRGSAKPNVYRECDNLAEMGFLTKEPGGYQAVAGMKVNVVEA